MRTCQYKILRVWRGSFVSLFWSLPEAQVGSSDPDLLPSSKNEQQLQKLYSWVGSLNHSGPFCGCEHLLFLRDLKEKIYIFFLCLTLIRNDSECSLLATPFLFFNGMIRKISKRCPQTATQPSLQLKLTSLDFSAVLFSIGFFCSRHSSSDSCPCPLS